ncbi:MAG TPA: 16S rRNA (cytidine(1402)-2'-O)-methyltransferase [Candidatus Hydrogenedentes bacterium]|nr:16S rRNA (cytidine(1402)-2'-O)-methyltransferase [Candidatus Hydrogenedentota bacterium]
MGTLYVVGTPIGNLEDISLRAQRILAEVAAVAAEDTRVTRKIYERYALSSPGIRFSCHEHNESQAVPRILGLLAAGENVALCSDGGMPGISDPGYRVINACHDAGHGVEIIPGPSAITTALVASGLPGASFTFKGFPPRKSGQRRRFLEEDKASAHTLVFFESPHRIAALLRDALEILGDRRAAVCVEMTKQYEAVHRDYLSELTRAFASGKTVRGEITVVVAGNNPKFTNPSASGNDT